MGKMYFPDEIPNRRNYHKDQLRELERGIRRYKLILALEVIVIVACILVAVFVL